MFINFYDRRGLAFYTYWCFPSLFLIFDWFPSFSFLYKLISYAYISIYLLPQLLAVLTGHLFVRRCVGVSLHFSSPTSTLTVCQLCLYTLHLSVYNGYMCTSSCIKFCNHNWVFCCVCGLISKAENNQHLHYDF